MIGDSIPWKEELVRVADRLEAKTEQRRWTDRGVYLVERDLMVSAYAMRKLIESHKVSNSLSKRPTHVRRFDLVGRAPDQLDPFDIADAYDLQKSTSATLLPVALCNQVVHSFVLTFSFDESSGLFTGFYVSSEKDKDKFLYVIPADDYIRLCCDIGLEDVYSKTYAPNAKGEMAVTEILGRP